MRALVLVLALSHTWVAVTSNDCDQIKPRRLTADNLDKVSVCLRSSSAYSSGSGDTALSPLSSNFKHRDTLTVKRW